MPLAIPLSLLVVLFFSIALTRWLQENQPTQPPRLSGFLHGDWRETLTAALGASPAAIWLSPIGQRATRWLIGQVSRLAAAKLSAGVAWLHALWFLLDRAAISTAVFAETVADAFEHALTVTVPHAIHEAVRGEAHLRRMFDEQLRRYARGIDRLVRQHVIPRLRHAEHAITTTIPREFGRIRARERALAHRIPRGLAHRLTRLEKITTYAAIAAVVVRVLARRFPWLFCRKLTRKRTGLFSRLCGLDEDLMASLLADTLFLAGTVSLVEFAHALQGLMDEAVTAVDGLIREDLT